MSIRLRSGGHSFPKELPAEYAAADRVVCSVLTHKNAVGTGRGLRTGNRLRNYLSLAGLGCAETECAVYSDPQRQQIAVMAVDKECRRQLAETAGDRVTFTSPLLFQPKFAGQGAWLIHTDGLLYIKIYDNVLRLAEVVRAQGDGRRPLLPRPARPDVSAQNLSALPVGKRHAGPPVAEVFQGCTMRIISGRYKGRAINPPKNLRARPTTDFAKENLFNVLTNLVDFEQCDVLDLFSGTGSISYEFASRGARSVTAVEINAVHYNFIRQTARELGCETIYPVKANAFLYLKSCPKQFDIVFSDAPYDLEGSGEIVRLVLDNGLLREGGLLIFEHSRNMDFSDRDAFWQLRSYGSVQFSFFKK